MKGNMLHVYLTIAMHLDKSGEGWPTQQRIAEMCEINRDTVGTAIKKLVKEGFIEAEKVRSKGKFDNTVYKIKFAPKVSENNHAEKPDMVKTEENKHSHHAGKTVTEKPSRKNRHGKSDTKEDISFKKDPSFKKDFDDEEASPIWETDNQYLALRSTFTSVGADDIKKHEEHHNKFLEAIQKVGFPDLIGAASKYIKATGKNAQIVLFLSGLFNEYLDKPKKQKVTHLPTKNKDNSDLPESVRNQEEGKTSNDDLTDEEFEKMKAQLHAKMKKMDENFERRKAAK
ncbi:helix-turn-helix domain-containing protein [Risungbinella massiliensis]|uniref:helix-turn-helix domain-containing protein n=1 Tax=Risungbinella massiliensis TaxID=1329796 RepID=UPI001C9D5E94|nr:helix-turn-helix domain-containing protein [Risungbinella massiliensis]